VRSTHRGSTDLQEISTEQVVVFERELQTLRTHCNLLEKQKGKLDAEVLELKKAVYELESALAATDQARMTQKTENEMEKQNLQASISQWETSLLTAVNEKAQLQSQLDSVRSTNTGASGCLFNVAQSRPLLLACTARLMPCRSGHQVLRRGKRIPGRAED
jgi:predicted RNase H-like nuclease (RuvC/YqgF family)